MDEDGRARRIDLLGRLTPRGFEIFKLTCERVSDRAIAIRLLATMRTVNLHQRAISNKLGIAER